MSIDTAGPASALARVAAIQSRFAVMAPAAAPSSATTATAAGAGTAASSAAAPSFDAVLSAALNEVSGTSGAGAGASTGDVGSRALAAARQYLGVPYVWGGTDPTKGLDCSGLVQRAFRDVGIELPRVAADQARAGTAVPDLAHARPGDLLAFGSPVDHIGIYAGNHTMVVAPRAGKDVMVQDVYRTPTAIRRIGEPGPVTGSSGASYSAASTAPSVAGSSAADAAAAPWVPAHLRSMFAAAAARHGVPVQLLTAVARAESGFNPTAVSPAGAVGIMQLMPATARGLGVDPRDPAQAVDGAARLLASHLDRFGSTSLALAAYNAGPGAVQRYGGIPPYPETQQYVRRVLGYAGSAA